MFVMIIIYPERLPLETARLLLLLLLFARSHQNVLVCLPIVIDALRESRRRQEREREREKRDPKGTNKTFSKMIPCRALFSFYCF